MLKGFRIVFILLLVFGFSGVRIGDTSEIAQYFPATPESYWVYEDQDGNELTRRAIEGERIGGMEYLAFEYEPTLENSVDYDYHIHPGLYQVNEEGVTFWVGDEARKALQARLAKEMDAFLKTAKQMGPPDQDIEVYYDVEAEIQDAFYMLAVPIAFNEKWDATQINAKITMKVDPPQEPGDVAFNFTITERGKVIGTENVETPAGTFQNCLKIEYRTYTQVLITPPEVGEDTNPSGETVTTLWVAPNVGIVKSHQKAEDIFLKIVPLPGIVTSTTVKTLQLKKYEIKSADTEEDKNNLSDGTHD